MHRFTRLIVFPTVLTVMILLLAAALYLARAEGSIPVLNGHVTSEQWSELPDNVALTKCTSQDCNTLKALFQSFEQLDSRDFPNSMARTKSGRDKHGILKELAVVELIERESSRRPEACKMLETLSANYFDRTVWLHGAELATLIDDGSGRCLHPVISSLPQSAEPTLIQDAYELCEARQEPGCSRLKELQR